MPIGLLICKPKYTNYPANIIFWPNAGQRWANLADGGSTVNQRWSNVSCLLSTHLKSKQWIQRFQPVNIFDRNKELGQNNN